MLLAFGFSLLALCSFAYLSLLITYCLSLIASPKICHPERAAQQRVEGQRICICCFFLETRNMKLETAFQISAIKFARSTFPSSISILSCAAAAPSFLRLFLLNLTALKFRVNRL